MLFMLLNILPHFLLQNCFSYFPPLKPRCVLWSEKYGNSFSQNAFKNNSPPVLTLLPALFP